MRNRCGECGWEYSETRDFEPGSGRCWRCAALAYKKGLERLKAKGRGVVEAAGATDGAERTEGETEDLAYWRQRVEVGLGVQLAKPLVDIAEAVEEWKAAPGGRDYAPSVRAMSKIVEAWDRLDKAAAFRSLDGASRDGGSE